MPNAAKNPCTYMGCTALISGSASRCEQHPHQRDAHRLEAERRRGSATERGYTSAWSKARDGYIRQHPLCVHCEREGFVQAATVVDHKVPHKGDKAIFWDSENWQSQCKMHHDRKTATEDGGWGRPVIGQGGRVKV